MKTNPNMTINKILIYLGRLSQKAHSLDRELTLVQIDPKSSNMSDNEYIETKAKAGELNSVVKQLALILKEGGYIE